MLDRLKSLLTMGGASGQDPGNARQLQLAVAALLVEAALMDGHMDEAESDRIRTLLCQRFDLDEEDAARLLAQARQANAAASQLLPFTRLVKDHFSAGQRVELMEMLWEVVYTDGRLHDYESNLIRRIGGLLFVPDQETGAARKRAMARLGVSEDPLA
ncbi:MAG: TerB family tellurite resistance protein [Rhodospirillales bacterium]|nr:TerB family tellurite resistance protein [Rhodospirillales bacterium]